MGFDDVAFFAEIVVCDVCGCKATGFLFGSVVVLDVNTGSVVVTPVNFVDSDDSFMIFVWESCLATDINVVVIDLLISDIVFVLVGDFVDSAFGCAAIGNISNDDFCIVVCAVGLLAGAVIVDAVGSNNGTGFN